MKIIADLIECDKCGNRAVELKAFLKDKWLETYDIKAYCDKCDCYFYPGEERKMKRLSFAVRYTRADGELGVLINGVKYRYFLDAGFIPKIEQMAKRRPGKALAFLKEVARGYEKET